MIGFFIKKWFFDFWDNLLVALLMNIAFVLPLGLVMIVPSLAASFGLVIGTLCSLVVVLFAFIFAGVCNRYTLDFVLSRNFQFSKFPGYLKQSWKPSIALGGLAYGLVLFIQIGLPFYNQFNQTVGLIITVFAFWLVFFTGLAVQYFWPLNAQFEPKIKKLFKKSFILMFDNPGFTLFMLLGAVIIGFLSVVSLSMFPGVTGLLLWFQVGFKLRMYKYDYLETVEPDQPRKKIKIPWDALLAPEREQTGPRSLKGMFFPWKE